MRRAVITILILALAAPALAQKLETEDQKTLYALGLAVGRSLEPFTLTPAELDLVKAGVTDYVTGKKHQIDLDAYSPAIQKLANARLAATSEKLKAASAGFIEKASKEKGAVKTASGLVYVPLKEGTGASPAATDTVKVHYTGTLTDGKVFDSSVKRNAPAEFPLDKVIKCWTEGVQKMKVGGKAKLVCPSDIAYGDRGSPPTIPGGATLVFEVELLEIKKP